MPNPASTNADQATSQAEISAGSNPETHDAWLALMHAGNYTPKEAKRAFLRGPKLREGINLVLNRAAPFDYGLC